MGPATRDKTGSALLPLLFCRHRPSGFASHWGRGPATSRVLLGGAPSTKWIESWTFPLLGVRDLHVSPGPSSVHARTPTRGSGEVARHHYRWCMQDPSPQGPLNATAPYIEDHAPATTTPTAGAGTATGAIFTGPRTISRTTATPAVFPQCTSYSIRPLYPAIQGKTTTSAPLHSCTPPPPCDYKRRRRTPFKGGWTLDSRTLWTLASLFQEDVQGLLRTHLNRLHF